MSFLEQKNYAPKPKNTFLSFKEQKEFQTKLNAEPMTWQQVYDSYK